MWPYFHDNINILLRHCPDTARECHRLSCMSLPVLYVQRHAGLHGTPRQVADKGQRRRLYLQTLERVFQPAENRIDQGAMECLGRVQSPRAYLQSLEARHDSFNIFDGAADHLVRSVVCRDAQADAVRACVVRLNFGCDLFRRREYGGHRARFHLRHQSAPRCGESHSVFETEHAGSLRRRNLANTVPQYNAGVNAHARP